MFHVANKPMLFKPEILSFFVEIGVTGATVLESTGMGRILTEEVPIFAGFRQLLAGSRPHNRMILAVVDHSLIDRIADGIHAIFAEHGQPGGGVFFSVPISRHWGIIKKDESL